MTNMKMKRTSRPNSTEFSSASGIGAMIMWEGGDVFGFGLGRRGYCLGALDLLGMSVG